ncbi:hypothetical protein NSS94_04280 [Paenibacillus sp. FSL L8-0644]|uniref:hypothetical protein n=1 Tax=Paenibacillus sp. FSL L8-0644 TaxID=2954523 RepID=UPI0030F549DE
MSGYIINTGDPIVFTGSIVGHADGVESRNHRSSMLGAGVAIEMMEPRTLGLAGGGGFIVISIVILMYYARTRSRKAA